MVDSDAMAELKKASQGTAAFVSTNDVVSAAVTTAPPTLNEFLEIYDTPTDIELESEQVWPAPPMLAL